jgi:hypothetical protein
MSGMRQRFLLALFAAVTLVVLGTTLGFGKPGDSPSPKSNFSLEQAKSFQAFPVFYAGDSVDGVPLVAVLRRNDTADYVAFIYGTCEATGETGCAPPGEVQVWPACRRNPSLYAGRRSPISPVGQPTTIRGVPAAFFEDGSRLEIQTGASTVVLFSSSPEFVLRLADALRGVNVSAEAGAVLPAPVPGALDGSLGCGT